MALHDVLPACTVRGSRAIHTLELVEVTDEDECGPPVGVVPQPEDALESLLRQLSHFVNDYQIEVRHAVPCFVPVLVQEKHTAQRVHVQIRKLLTVGAGQHPCGAGDADVRPGFDSSANGDLHARGFAAPNTQSGLTTLFPKSGFSQKTCSKLSVKTFAQNVSVKTFAQNVFGTQTLNNFYKP